MTDLRCIKVANRAAHRQPRPARPISQRAVDARRLEVTVGERLLGRRELAAGLGIAREGCRVVAEACARDRVGEGVSVKVSE
jgi:hypothetical protein